MSTTTVTLEPTSIAASARSLKTEFLKARLTGVTTVAAKGAVHIEMPIARLADYQFVYSRERCSWTTSKRKVVLELKGFVVEQCAKRNVFLVVLRRTAAQPKPGNDVREIFWQRSLRAIEELKALDERKLVEAVKAPTDFSVLLSALNTEEALASIRVRDPLAGARLRGFEAKRNLIDAEGGALSSAQVAQLLKISRQAVDKRRKEGKLLALELGRKGYRYPSWQFGLEGLADVLAALKDRDGWEQLAFFLNPTAALDDRTPVEVLRKGKGNIAAVVAAAAVYGEQG